MPFYNPPPQFTLTETLWVILGWESGIGTKAPSELQLNVGIWTQVFISFVTHWIMTKSFMSSSIYKKTPFKLYRLCSAASDQGSRPHGSMNILSIPSQLGFLNKAYIFGGIGASDMCVLKVKPLIQRLVRNHWNANKLSLGGGRILCPCQNYIQY